MSVVSLAGVSALAAVHHGAAGFPRASRGRRGYLCGERAFARGLPYADGRGPGRAADRPVPARPPRRIRERAGETRLDGVRPGSWRRPWPCRSWCWRWTRCHRARGLRGRRPRRAARRAGPGGRPGRDRAAGAQRGAGAQPSPAGHHRHPGGAHGARGAGAHRPRAARRGRAPYLHDRGAGGDGPAGHPGDARRGSAAAAGDRRYRAGRPDRNAAAARRAARGRPGRRPGQLGADRRPQPGLQQLNELLDEARDASGAGARLIVSGPAGPSTPASSWPPTASSRKL